MSWLGQQLGHAVATSSDVGCFGGLYRSTPAQLSVCSSEILSNGTSLSDRGFEPQLRLHQIAYFDPQRVGDGEDRRNSWV